MRNHGAVFLVLSPAMIAGCTEGMPTRSFQSRVIRAASADEVFDAAQVMLRREFGRLNVESPQHRIVSDPVEYRTSSESGTARDFYGGRSTMRRTAHFALAPRGDGVVVRLRIDIERQDTERREVFQSERQPFTDAPGQTPVERDAATSARQNTVWTFVKRDRPLERALLAELQERFAPAPAEAGEVTPTADRAAETP